MQNDFIDMALGTKEAVAIVPRVKEKIQEYVKNGDEIIFTRDTHYEDYMETDYLGRGEDRYSDFLDEVQVKDKIRILYPTPTIWNSHCIAAFNDNGKLLLDAFNDKDVSQKAWERYGFRVGVTGGNYDVSKVNINGIPQEITSVTSGLRMDIYNELITYLSSN